MKNVYSQIYINNTYWYVGNQVEDQVVIQVEREVWRWVRDQVEDQVWRQAEDQVLRNQVEQLISSLEIK